MNKLFDVSDFDIRSFRRKLITWFKINKRNLPWRNDNHWYPVFLSEFLLQQTQVDQALPYYNNFISKYPDVYSLSKASQQDILSLWAGLGYYSRARNLLKAAIQIVDQFDGKFPENYNDALSLPGIGDYTASAILSISFNLGFPVVDGNVQRVITRLFIISDDIRSVKTNSKIRNICSSLIDPVEAGSFNEGMMELGATICTPKNPNCEECPVSHQCKAYMLKKVNNFPYKSPPAPKKQWFHYVLVIYSHHKFLIVKRKSTGLLASLWEFPVLPVEQFEYELNEVGKCIARMYGIEGAVKNSGKQMTHTYSHIKLKYIPILVELNEEKKPKMGEYQNFAWIEIDHFNSYPIHNAHKKIIDWLKNLEIKTK